MLTNPSNEGPQIPNRARQFVDAKGPTDYAAKHLANVYKLIGAQKILGWTDGEYAVKRLKEKAAKDAEIEMILREPTAGDPQANGFIENAVREKAK